MYMKTGNALPGRECLAAELHDKANSNPNDFVPNKVFFPVQLGNWKTTKVDRLWYKGHC